MRRTRRASEARRVRGGTGSANQLVQDDAVVLALRLLLEPTLETPVPTPAMGAGQVCVQSLEHGEAPGESAVGEVRLRGELSLAADRAGRRRGARRRSRG